MGQLIPSRIWPRPADPITAPSRASRCNRSRSAPFVLSFCLACGSGLLTGCSQSQFAEGDSAQGAGRAISSGDLVCVQGRITDEGVECPTLHSPDGQVYSLAGDLGEFKSGDNVCVCGPSGGLSFCMQGITVAVHQITKADGHCTE